MKDKYLSIITNFGCHYKCPYCIVKKNNVKIPSTTVEGLKKEKKEFDKNKCNIISISGGGDPLFNWYKHTDWYDKLFSICGESNIPIEMHTSYTTSSLNALYFHLEKFYRVVYHLNSITQLREIYRRGNEIVRVVFVVTEDFTEDDILEISDYVEESSEIDELSFRQLVDENYETKFYLHQFLQKEHKIKWYYIQQNDYNLYYCENKIYTTYKNLGEGAE